MGWLINLIIWLVVGGIIGWIASMIMRTDAEQGWVMNVVVGIVGAFIGGIIFWFLPGSSDTINSIATVGTALMDEDDLDVDATVLELLRFGLNGTDRRQEFKTCGGTRADEIWCAFELDTNDADPQLAILEDMCSLDPIGILIRNSIHNVSAKEWEVRTSLVLL